MAEGLQRDLRETAASRYSSVISQPHCLLPTAYYLRLLVASCT